MNFFLLEQLPVPRPEVFGKACTWSPQDSLQRWIERRAVELSYTAVDMKSFAESLDDEGPPFRWDTRRRETLRAELDAAFLHLYGIDREDAQYILETFPIANRKDPELASRVLEVYERIAEAIDTGEPFASSLDPQPGQGPRHPEKP